MSRPKQQLISRENAAEASLEVIDEEGLDGFRVTKVAKKLNVQAPSLYHHFRGKDELLAEVARLLLHRTKLPPADRKTDWREAIVRVSRSSWRSALKHPNAAPLLLQFFPRTLLTDAYEHWAKVFAVNEIPVDWHLMILEGSENLTFGSALFAAAQRVRGSRSLRGHDSLADPNSHPYFAAAVKAAPRSEERRFVDNLRCYLRGVPG